MKSKIIEGSGNVFADIGLPNPEEHFEKATTGCEIVKIIKQRKLTQAQAAKLLEVDQAKISALLNGRFYGLSLERLIKWLRMLGKRVDITITDAGAEKAPTRTNRPSSTHSRQGSAAAHA